MTFRAFPVRPVPNCGRRSATKSQRAADHGGDRLALAPLAISLGMVAMLFVVGCGGGSEEPAAEPNGSATADPDSTSEPAPPMPSSGGDPSDDQGVSAAEDSEAESPAAEDSDSLESGAEPQSPAESPAGAADEQGATDEQGAEEDDGAEDEAAKFEVPEDADVEELLAFIDRVKEERGDTLRSVQAAAEAVEGATAQIAARDDVSEEVELQAVRERLVALEFLGRFESERGDQRDEIIARLTEDDREPFRKLGQTLQMEAKLRGVGGMSSNERRDLVEQLVELVDGSDGTDQLAIAITLAQQLEQLGDDELAADLYERAHGWLKDSEDERYRQVADKMAGSARRLRLPNNFVDVFGTTAEGDSFDWESYRGKVVLIDFWASWCGPCRAEIPNMKANLDEYGDQGFEIVGVNLDDSMEDYRQFVEREEIGWVNLISDEEGSQGWDHPLATHYGVMSIPTAILVDEEGKAVSMSARGPELDRKLEELLGDAEEEKDRPNDESESKSDGKSDEESDGDAKPDADADADVKDADAKDADAKDTDAKDTDAKDTDAKDADSEASGDAGGGGDEGADQEGSSDGGR